MKRMNIRNLALSIILILLLTFGAGCTLLPDINISPSPTPTTPTPQDTSPIDSGWTSPPATSQAPVLPSIADAIAKVKPSVVAINTEVTTLDIFNRPFTQEGAGSGWIISENGYIVTNNHVIEGAESVTITLDDGRTFPAEMVRADYLSDLAVVKINAQNLLAAEIGDSSALKIGDWLVAIGNSLGQGIRATQGIVSRKDVSIGVGQGQTLYGLIETDAAINPGNSGGPLVNMAGEVIGINSVKRIQVEVEGVGYAIGTNEAMPIIQQLINTGFVVRPFLGVQGLLTVDQAVVNYFNLGVNEGALIRGIVSGGPADVAGLKAGDVITKFGNTEISDANKLLQILHSSQVGQTVEITFWRGKNKNTTSVTLAESPVP
ncbi:S1C family serine protease [Chloroflexota bacterium]